MKTRAGCTKVKEKEHILHGQRRLVMSLMLAGLRAHVVRILTIKKLEDKSQLCSPVHAQLVMLMQKQLCA
jgi:hypothetical protein